MIESNSVFTVFPNDGYMNQIHNLTFHSDLAMWSDIFSIFRPPCLYSAVMEWSSAPSQLRSADISLSCELSRLTDGTSLCRLQFAVLTAAHLRHQSTCCSSAWSSLGLTYTCFRPMCQRIVSFTVCCRNDFISIMQHALVTSWQRPAEQRVQAAP